ncbi:MAG: hypothetical protein CFE32_06010 [Alphaproteobacteria bacterium PA3]|nr:MAG: hypothetical protein CFE32_06010 [Alphaproteobacteria bacterium PA3]
MRRSWLVLLAGVQAVLKKISVFDGTHEPLRQSLFDQMGLGKVFVLPSARDGEGSGQGQGEIALVWR